MTPASMAVLTFLSFLIPVPVLAWRDRPRREAIKRKRCKPDTSPLRSRSRPGHRRKSADEPVSALTRIKKRHGEAILIPTDLVFRTEKARITRAVLKTGLPAVYQDLSIAEAGGLISYGPDGAEIGQIMADLVERILRGAKPAELPVEQVTKLKLVVNLKTAKEMGIVIPQSIMTRADELIR